MQVDTLWSGTAGMRLAGETYLPRNAEEPLDNYKRRLARSTLHNYYKSSIQSAVGKVFSKDIHVEKPSLPMQLLFDDIDAQGRNLTQFAKDVLQDAINHGITFILVDHSRVPEEYKTLADKNASGARPYWVGIPATKVLDARSADFGGTQRLSYFRYEEEVWEPSADGFGGSGYRQVRIFKQDPNTEVMFAVYREDEVGTTWRLIDSGVLAGVTAIPVIPVNVNRTSFFMGRPPLQDLADVNVQHWQCSSDYQNSVHVASIPFLLAKGMGPQELDTSGNPQEMRIAVNSGVMAVDPNADVQWIEVTGAALAAARANLDSLVQEMEKLGTTLCTSTPGGVTATEKSVNAAEANSTVKSWALALQDAINGSLAFTAEYISEQPTALAQVNTEFASDYASDTTFSSVLEAHKLGVIDAETVVAEAKRRNVLDPTAKIKVPEPKLVEPVKPEPAKDAVIGEKL
jgi:hypothetical protein